MGEDGRGVSLKRVRAGLVVLALALVATVGGFLGYARYRMRKFDLGLAGLSRRLGATITQESDNFTYSQAVGGRTVFTVHAAKQIDHGNGMLTLHEVAIALYGREAGQVDRIHGSEFEYDQKQSVLRAVGDVYLDLVPPTGEQPGVAGRSRAASPSAAEERTVHIKTSGLVFRQKERSAETAEQVDFRVGGWTGSAVGASYDSGSGVVILDSAVRVSGAPARRPGGNAYARPMVLTSSRAEMDRMGEVVKLERAKLVTETDTGADAASAEHALVHLAGDGTPRQVDAEGDVRLTEASGGGGEGVTTADRMRLELNDAGQPRSEDLAGNVRLTEEDARRRQTGRAAEAQVGFDGQGRPVRALVTGGVELREAESGGARQLNAAKVELALAGGGRQPVLLMGAVASGAEGAVLRTEQRRPDQTSSRSSLRGDRLTARFAEDGPAAKKPGTHLTGLEGRGRTSLEEISFDAKGAQTGKQTSTGETLDAEFRQEETGRVTLATAVQRGGVSLVREAPGRAAAQGGKPAGVQIQHARAEVASYDADADRMTMTGAVQVQDAESALFAERVEMDHASGDSSAEGSVRVSYLQGGSGGEPVHVLAARAVSRGATGVSEFSGGPGVGGRAKLWQGGSQVEAPVLDFNRVAKTMVARDEHGTEGAVHTVLVDAGGGEAKGRSKTSGAPVRVVSRQMLYDDAARQVRFTGGVRVDDQEGTMWSEEATVYLAASGSSSPNQKQAGGAAVSLGGRVDQIVGTGAVVMEQPGRRATGERLVYLAADQTFVLTGTASDPPKMVDAAQGSVTGASLRFRSGEDSVVISGKGDAGETRRVRSEAKVRPKESR